jgi:DmsE family decaheme c-type cytochrome
MWSLENRNTPVGPGSMSLSCWFGNFTNCTSLVVWISIIFSGLIYLALLDLVQPARAEEPKLIGVDYSSVRGASSPAKIVELGRNHQFYDHAISALVDFVQVIDAEQPKLVSLKKTKNSHPQFDDADFTALREYAQQIGADQPELVSIKESKSPHPQFEDADFAALREYAQQIGVDTPNSASAPRLRMAEADNAFDALREFLRRGAQPNLTPDATPNQPRPAAPRNQARPAAPRHDPPVIDAHFLGAKTCLFCHASQAVSFGKTLMGRIGSTQQGKFECENCHGPGSVHVQAVGCAACHGEGGISKRPGMPSLVGQDPQYLVAAMKAYTTGQRKHDLMKALLTGVGEAELNNIALYYGRQVPARTQTPTIGDPSAGKTASTLCAGCHGEQGVSVNPAWPSLAGQDSQYLADALKAYKYGSRNDATMKALVASLDERTINDIASYYASLRPAQPSPTNSTNAPARHDPVLVRNGLVASLDERTINNIASYYASLRPAQPNSAKNAPAKHDPILVSKAAPIDGRSVGGIISFRKDDPSRKVEDNNAICLGCHERGDRTYWNGSTHETRGVACTECHTVMRPISRKASLKTVNEPETCFQCHKDRRAQIFRSSHMPVREGKITCSNCHNPHGSATEALLKENSINDNCYKCHAEKRGPFLFEHAPVRENCLSCHDAHGTTNEYMLKVSRPRLCAECHGFGHGLTSGPLAVQTIGRSCQNCHTAIHGTNSPAGPLLHR